MPMPMRRRTLLTGAMTLAVAQVACQSQSGERLHTEILQDSLPAQLVQDFRRTLPEGVAFRSGLVDSFSQVYQHLQQWQTPGYTPRRWSLPWQGSQPAPPNWISLGDYWLAGAIAQGLIQPFTATAAPHWGELGDRWHDLVTRNAEGRPQSGGQVWAAPYRWGCLVLVYNQSAFSALGWQPQAWSDLWHPDLAGRILLPDHPQLRAAIVLQSLQHSINTPDSQKISGFNTARDTLQAQARGYSSDRYMEPVIRGDVWVAVGWSTEVRPVLEQYRQMAAVVPDPGTVLSADVWVKPIAPTNAAAAQITTDLDTPSPLTPRDLTPSEQDWIDYWWQEPVSLPLSLLSAGLAPRLLEGDLATLAPGFSATRFLMPTPAQIAASEFLLPQP